MPKTMPKTSKKNTKKETAKKETKKAENTSEIKLQAEKAKRTETSDKTWFIAAQKQAIVTCDHKFTGEKITIVRPQRRDNEPFTQAIVVHYPNGSYGCLCMFSADREKWALKQLEKLQARQVAEKPGFEHDFGSLATVETVNLATKEMVPTKTRKAQVPEKTQEKPKNAKKTAKPAKTNKKTTKPAKKTTKPAKKTVKKIFTNRTQAIEFAKEIGSKATKVKGKKSTWQVEKTN